MRIKTGFNSCDVKFEILKAGEAFVYKNKFDSSRTFYLKTEEIQFEKFGRSYCYNAINLDAGYYSYFADSDIVCTTNAHIEE